MSILHWARHRAVHVEVVRLRVLLKLEPVPLRHTFRDGDAVPLHLSPHTAARIHRMGQLRDAGRDVGDRGFTRIVRRENRHRRWRHSEDDDPDRIIRLARRTLAKQ